MTFNAIQKLKEDIVEHAVAWAQIKVKDPELLEAYKKGVEEGVEEGVETLHARLRDRGILEC